jgi:multidrug efflux pump subunit AcrB
MWIVKIALNRPFTFIVLALLILILAPVVILRTPTDIFPSINIPVVAVAWTYTGLSPEETEGRITTVYERLLTTTVDNIEHLESTTVNGTAIVKIYLQPTASIDRANAQVTAVSQTILRYLPPGALPPLIINYSASTVPVLQLGLSGKNLTEPQLNDIALNFLRTQLVTVPGASIPFPFGGKFRQVMVNLNQRMLQAKGLSPNDVLTALNNQNLILLGGTVKMGDFEYDVDLNADVKTVQELNDLPHQDRWKLYDLSSRCCHCERRRRAADEHRPSGRQSRSAGDCIQSRGRFDDRPRQGCPPNATARRADSSA